MYILFKRHFFFILCFILFTYILRSNFVGRKNVILNYIFTHLNASVAINKRFHFWVYKSRNLSLSVSLLITSTLLFEFQNIAKSTQPWHFNFKLIFFSCSPSSCLDSKVILGIPCRQWWKGKLKKTRRTQIQCQQNSLHDILN